jgi:hypothetical protein
VHRCAAEELIANLGLRNETVCTLHANYIKGNRNKMTSMDAYGFWLATRTGDNKSIKELAADATVDLNKVQWGGTCREYRPFDVPPKAP